MGTLTINGPFFNWQSSIRIMSFRLYFVHSCLRLPILLLSLESKTTTSPCLFQSLAYLWDLQCKARQNTSQNSQYFENYKNNLRKINVFKSVQKYYDINNQSSQLDITTPRHYRNKSIESLNKQSQDNNMEN